MRVLVCGGRNFNDYNKLKDALDIYCNDIMEIIHGGARGADHLAARYANERCIPTQVFLPDWNTYGKAAGPIRNKQMLDQGEPDVVVAFPGGRGTASMVRLAREAGVCVITIT